MLPKKTYTKVLKMLEHYREQHLEDRQENPTAIPPSWGSSIRSSIEHICREDHVRDAKNLVEPTVQYLIEKGLLVRYAGDVTFPTDEKLPTADEIVTKTLETLKKKS